MSGGALVIAIADDDFAANLMVDFGSHRQPETLRT
jgi:hypothetical protein